MAGKPKLKSVEIDLGALPKLIGSFSEAVLQSWAEAASICLASNGFIGTAQLIVSGTPVESAVLMFGAPSAVQTASWEPERATEDGAYAVASGVAFRILGAKRMFRSFRGDGYDLRVGFSKKGELAQETKPLEVSGIRTGADRVAARTKSKVDRVKGYGTDAGGVIIVVEFSTPVSEVTQL